MRPPTGLVGLMFGLLAVACEARSTPPPAAPKTSAPPPAPAPESSVAAVARKAAAPAPPPCTEACTPKRLVEARRPSHLLVDANNLYWLRGESLYTMPRDGGATRELASDLVWATPVLDDDAVYACRKAPQLSVDIVRIAKDGSGEHKVANAASCRLAPLGDKLYFPERDDKWHQWLAAVPVDAGTGAKATRIAKPTRSPEQLLADGTHLYWQHSNEIHRYDPKTKNKELVAKALGSVREVGLTDTHVVWLQGSDLARVPKRGGDLEVIANHQDVRSFASEGDTLYWASGDDDAWRRLSVDGTMVTHAVPGGASSIAVDGTRVWWTALDDDGGIDSLQTCGCTEDVLVPTPRLREAVPPDPADVARWRLGRPSQGEVEVQIRDLSHEEQRDVYALEARFGGGRIPLGTEGLPKRLDNSDAYVVATTAGVFDVELSGFETGLAGEGTHLYAVFEGKKVRGDGGLVTKAPAPGLGKLREATPDPTLRERYLPAVERALRAAKLRRPVVGKRHVQVVPANLPAPHTVLIFVSAPNPDDSTEYLSAFFAGDPSGEISASIYGPQIRLDTFGVEYFVDTDGDGLDEVIYHSSYYEGYYEHLLTWKGNKPETTTLAGDGA